ncbi:MAG: hypothetical protein CM15mP109_14980 [Candidatus Dadabacteria bacterium]|nr:MAG: hypothetical protein CM15mP109_14980 [Candidatus Dadabacteria bacterium]
MIPYQNEFTLIGTTDKEVDSYLNPTITPEEQSYLLNAVNCFLKIKFQSLTLFGLMLALDLLLEDFNQSASKVTRDYEFDLDVNGAPILSVFGGKLTTYRKLAEHALRNYPLQFQSKMQLGQIKNSYLSRNFYIRRI